LKKRYHVAAPELLSHNHLLLGVDAVDLKPAILKVANFQDSQITRKMIHRMDDSIAFAFGGFASRLRGLSGLSEGTQRQYRRG
jgi:hypothetical protein